MCILGVTYFSAPFDMKIDFEFELCFDLTLSELIMNTFMFYHPTTNSIDQTTLVEEMSPEVTFIHITDLCS